jgi:hypothetical protein
MKTLLLLFAFIVLSVSCKKHEGLHHSACGTSATVRDIQSQNGCGFVFELTDGTKLEPSAPTPTTHTCGSHNSQTTSNPLSTFPFQDGQKVKIGYEIVNSTVNACGAKAAKITCVEIVNSISKD